MKMYVRVLNAQKVANYLLWLPLGVEAGTK